jgi:hypothetical protein
MITGAGLTMAAKQARRLSDEFRTEAESIQAPRSHSEGVRPR